MNEHVTKKAATATQKGAKVLTELADTAWSNTKMLNDKIIRNADHKR